MAGHLLFTIGADVAIFASLGLNTWLCIRNWRTHKRIISSLKTEYLSGLIDCLDEVCASVCPFCAFASGKVQGEIRGQLSGSDKEWHLDPEEETGGVHMVHGGPRDLPEEARQVPCNAAPIHELKRRLFSEYMTGVQQ